MAVAVGTAKPRRGQLSRGGILGTALELVDEEGLESLTLRQLAAKLGVDPMSIYNHVSGKDALLDGVAEVLWSEVRIPSEVASWKESMRTFAASLRTVAQAHPKAYGLLLGRGILPGPALEAIDSALVALESAGLTIDKAAEMVRTLVAFAAGYAMLELASPPPEGSTPLEQIVCITRTLPKDAPTHLVEVARLMCDCDMDRQFDLGLDLILAGLEARLPHKGVAHRLPKRRTQAQ
ncbi:MAG: TetR/AcrR family transcriptional regulator C-terminal domain-containing protein [Candidatus Dormibacterales bacterium]